MHPPSHPPALRLHELRALRARQQREAARGCLLALVLEGAALLGGLLWLVARLLEMSRLALTAAIAFAAFTLAALGVGLVLTIQGNLPQQRRLRSDLAEAEAAAQRGPLG